MARMAHIDPRPVNQFANAQRDFVASDSDLAQDFESLGAQFSTYLALLILRQHNIEDHSVESNALLLLLMFVEEGWEDPASALSIAGSATEYRPKQWTQAGYPRLQPSQVMSRFDRVTTTTQFRTSRMPSSSRSFGRRSFPTSKVFWLARTCQWATLADEIL